MYGQYRQEVMAHEAAWNAAGSKQLTAGSRVTGGSAVAPARPARVAALGD